MNLHRLFFVVLLHATISFSPCWKHGWGVTSTIGEVVSVETIEHCEAAVRIIAREGRNVKSVSFVPKGLGDEGFCKMSNNKRSHKEDSAYYTLLECLSPTEPGTFHIHFDEIHGSFQIQFTIILTSFTNHSILRYFRCVHMNF
jgi:hypothetical protein